jgi:GAF domain-containing protein
MATALRKSPPSGVDHPLAVALRTDPVPTFLEGALAVGTLELAVPMSHRGELTGIVLLGHKPGEESYRPDEIELLAFAAQQIGLDLHALEIEGLRHDLAEARNRARTLESLVAGRMAPPGLSPAD